MRDESESVLRFISQILGLAVKVKNNYVYFLRKSFFKVLKIKSNVLLNCEYF